MLTWLYLGERIPVPVWGMLFTVSAGFAREYDGEDLVHAAQLLVNRDLAVERREDVVVRARRGHAERSARTMASAAERS